jgi:hypothetical protein
MANKTGEYLKPRPHVSEYYNRCGVPPQPKSAAVCVICLLCQPQPKLRAACVCGLVVLLLILRGQGQGVRVCFVVSLLEWYLGSACRSTLSYRGIPASY